MKLWVLSIALLSFHCGSQTKDVDATNEGEGVNGAAIVNGTPVEADSDIGRTTVMFTGLEKPAHSGCTATLIDAHHALTARHCLLGATPGSTGLMFAVKYQPGVTLVPVTAMVSYDEGFENDIAVLTFTGDIPEGYRTVALSGATLIKAGTHVVTAGYGKTENTPESERGTLRSVAGKVTQVLRSAKRVRMQGEGGVCNGDSGGPDFVRVDGKLVQLGIHVSGNCQDVTLSTDVRKYIEWIRSTGATPEVDMRKVNADP